MKTLSATAMSLFLILNPLCTYAQGIIHGYVLDSLTMDQLKGAAITLTGTSFSTVSNMDGEFRITEIPPGEYMVQASYLGYKEKKYLIDIRSEKPLELNIELLPTIAIEDGDVFTQQARGQAEEINQEIRSNTITNVISGKKSQNMPDENIPLELNRLPGVSIIYDIPQHITYCGETVGDLLDIPFLPQDDFSFEDDPVSRVLIRGLDSKYSSITINGIRISPTSSKDQSVDLGIFSERGFQKIELQKTVTSDEDGDVTAGAISITTGEAPYKRTIKAELLGNDNRLDNSANQYSFIGSYGERFFDNALGIQVDANVDKKILSSEYENQTVNELTPIINSPGLLYTNTEREKDGANVLLDFFTPDGGSMKFSNILDKTKTDYFESGLDSSISNYQYVFREREAKQGVFLSSLKGNNYLFGFDVDWNAAFSESKTDHPFDYSLNFYGYRWQGHQPYMGNTVDNPSENYCRERTASLDFDRKYTIADEITGELKFGGKYTINSRSYDEHLRADNGDTHGSDQYRRLVDGSLAEKDFSGTRFDGLVGKYGMDITLPYFQDNPPGERSLFDTCRIPLISEDALRLWRQLNYSPYYLNDGADINSYNLSENFLAGYIMHDLSFGKWAKFITGVRIESEHNDFSGYYFPKQLIDDATLLWDGTPQQTNMYHYNKITILPNFQMVLRPNDFLNLRLAAYKTLIRPDCDARTPKIFGLYIQGDMGSSSQGYLNMGNPDLKNADVWNYEFQTQFYGKDIGQFSINAFYKDIEGMVQGTNGIQLSNASTIDALGINRSSYPVNPPVPNSSYNLYTYFNSPKPTHIWGFEIEHQANFRYLPGLLKNIVLDYNFSFLRSEIWELDISQIEFSTAQDVVSYKKGELGDIPGFLANVSLGYDINGFSFRVSYFYQSECAAFEQNYSLIAIAPIKETKFSRLDVAVKQQILKNISVILNINNITNFEEEDSWRRDPDLNYPPQPWQTAQAYRYGMNFDFGVRIDL